MKKTLYGFIFLAEIILATSSYSQAQPSWSIAGAIGGGGGINEAIVQAFNPQFRVYALWLNGIAPHFSLESGVGFSKISSPNQGGFSEYSSNLIPIDLRIRFAPLEPGEWQPYVYAGIGLLSYSISAPPPNISESAKLSGLTGFIPLGIGLYHPLSNNVAIDLQIGEGPTFSDDLNPVRDNRNDASWGFTIGISYSFGGSKSGSDDEFDLGARGSVRILENVTFDSATSRIKKQSETQLLQILATLDNHPDVEVEFRTYTDDSGDFNTNMALTSDRAESVKIWLVSRGISVSRISTQGYGPHNPLVQNDTPEHRKQNCRIEIVRMK